MMQRILRHLCLLCCVACFAGCESRSGGLVTEQGTMTFEEMQEMQARSLARERTEAGTEDAEEAVEGL